MATTSIPRAGVPRARHRLRVAPVVLWAATGALILAYQAYVLIAWVTGPYFKAVPVGPSVPPTYMKVAVIGWEVIGWPLLAACLYWFLIRPWRRERRLATDGLFLVSWLMLYFWDPVSSWGGHWFTYNAYAFNRGSWLGGMPFQGSAKPGAMVLEPFVWALPAYGWGLFVGTTVAGWAMGRVRRRWPRIRPVALILFCWVFMIAMDVLLEGVLWMPQGLFTTAGTGGLPTVFLGSHGNEFALSEAVFWGGAWAAISCLRYFRDDQGRTIAERGIDTLNIGSRRQAGLRLLAVLGACQALMIGVYVVPIGVMAKIHTNPWPASIRDKSYLNDHICGTGTDRSCSGN